MTNFYLLQLMSNSGRQGPELHFDGISKSYFFLKRNEKGEYYISTPTSGFDIVLDNNVHATYRHSYHQALVPIEYYEITMKAIFNNYHGLIYDTSNVKSFIENNLKLKPAGFRVSASRALIVSNNEEVINLLINKIDKNTEDDFTTVVCIWTLKEFKPGKIKKMIKVHQ